MAAKQSTGNRILRIAQPLFFVVAVAAIVYFLVSQWSALREYPWRILPGLLLLSVMLLLSTWAVEVEIWRRILHHMGGRLAYAPSFRIWFLSAVLRYIPGNIWQPLSMTVYCTRYGVQPEVTITSILFYQVMILLAAAPFLALYLWLSAASGFLATYLSNTSIWLVILFLIPVVVFILRPNWLINVLNAILVRFHRPAMKTQFTSATLLLLILAAIVNWVMWGVTFALFTLSIAELPALDPQLFALLVITYPIAYAVGFLSLITPSGFGVREGAFVLLLSPVMAGSVVAVAALAMRVFTAIGELCLALISAPFERVREAGNPDTDSSGNEPAGLATIPEPDPDEGTAS